MNPATQTPQTTGTMGLLSQLNRVVYRRATEDGFVATDTAACLTHYTETVVHGVSSTASNLKVTFPEDLALAESLLSRSR